MPQTATDLTWLWWAVAAIAGVVLLLAWWVWRKSRPFAAGDVFKASRLSRGNHLFPTQVFISPSSVVQYTPRWIGRQEETIHLAHVSSVKIVTGALLSTVVVETSGGSDPILCSGHTKGDATRMKALIERYQDQHFREVASKRPPADSRPNP